MTRKITISIIASILGFIALIFALNFLITNKIKGRLEQHFTESAVNYEQLDFDLLSRNVVLKNPDFSLKKYEINASRVKLKNLNYRDYLFNDKIQFQAVIIDGAVVVISKRDSVKGVEKTTTKKPQQKPINIKRVVFNNAYLKVRENEEAKQNTFFVKVKQLKFKDVHFDSLTAVNKIPFNYQGVNLVLDSLFYAMNPEHDLTISSLKLDGDLMVQDLQIKSKYSRAEFDKRQRAEKDQISFRMKLLDLKDFEWKMVNDSLLLTSPFTSISRSDLNVYRNKELPDDTKVNDLYSKRLRELGVKLKFDSIKIANSSVTYEEKLVASRPPSKISFNNLQASIYNLTNLNLGGKDFPITKVKAKTLLMNESRLTFNMEFDVSNRRDEFQVSGSMGKISASAMNSFLKPAMNVLVKGEIESLYYNFHGNPRHAVGDMKLKYNDFKVEVLQKEGEKKNKILSGLANLIVKNKTNNKRMDQQDIQVDRDNTKSFWNYFWLMIRNGAMKSFLKF